MEVASVHPNPEQTALGADLQRRVHRLIDGLPEELRQPLALSTIQELTSSEVAQILGTEEVTVRSQISVARVKLAKYVRGRA